MKASHATRLAAAAALGSAIALAPGLGTAAVTLTHVHGLSYSADGKRLMIPSHHGLAIWDGKRWSKGPGPEHDYMGFAATGKQLYSSGHPAHGSGLKNPFGLIRSRDGGKTWDRLGMEGESDFHVLATGWETNAIYVYNPAPNSRMKSAGIHATLNDGFSWRHARATGLSGDVQSLAVHPSDPSMLAAVTKAGLFLSQDGGDSFRRLADGLQILSAYFDLDAKHLWFAAFDGKARLYRLDWTTGQRSELPLPRLSEDGPAYIAQNPAKRDEYAIATFRKSVYVSRDGGRTWTLIADQGVTR